MSVIATTERLVLRVPRADDLDALAAMWGDAETMRFIGDGTPWTRDKVAERLARGIETHARSGLCFWTVERREDGAVLGQCGVVPIGFNGPEFELGYRLGRTHWGGGYATEAARAAATHALNPVERGGAGVRRLVAVAYEENTASRRVLAKTGFTEVGPTDLYYDVRTVLHERRADHGPQAT